jgi:hypothetical protein
MYGISSSFKCEFNDFFIFVLHQEILSGQEDGWTEREVTGGAFGFLRSKWLRVLMVAFCVGALVGVSTVVLYVPQLRVS